MTTPPTPSTAELIDAFALYEREMVRIGIGATEGRIASVWCETAFARVANARAALNARIDSLEWAARGLEANRAAQRHLEAADEMAEALGRWNDGRIHRDEVIRCMDAYLLTRREK